MYTTHYRRSWTFGRLQTNRKKITSTFFLFEKKKYIYLHTIKELRQSNINTIFASDKESSQNEQKKKLKKNEERKEWEGKKWERNAYLTTTNELK